MDYNKERIDYQLAELLEENCGKDPIELLRTWLSKAQELKIVDPNAASLSTISHESSLGDVPNIRTVLIKQIDSNGLSFYTNHLSEKGKELEKNNAACLLFFWREMQRQVKIKCVVNKTSRKVSEDYFKTRPKGSQLAATISKQSQKITSREELENMYNRANNSLNNIEIACPKNWGGYIATPLYFEFWQGRKSRLHDRIVFEQIDNSWRIYRLSP